MVRTKELDAHTTRLVAKLCKGRSPWERPGYLLARRVLKYYEDDLRGVQRMRRWVAHHLSDDRFGAKRQLVALDRQLARAEQRTAREMARAHPSAQAKTGPRDDVTRAVVAVARCLYPKGMRRGHRMAGASTIAAALNQAGARSRGDKPFSPNTVYQALRNYHNRPQRHRLKIGGGYEPFRD